MGTSSGTRRRGLALEELDGIGAVRAGAEGGVARPRDLAAGGLAAGQPFRHRQVGDDLPVLVAHPWRDGRGFVAGFVPGFVHLERCHAPTSFTSVLGTVNHPRTVGDRVAGGVGASVAG